MPPASAASGFISPPHLGPSAPLDDLRTIIRRVRRYDWHIAIHVTGNAILELLDFIKTIDAPVVIDHMGRTDINEGPEGKAFRALRDLLEGGKVWVKLSGTDRVSKQAPPFRDAVALARILAEQMPERILWGTDWPHPNVRLTPSDGELVDLIAEIATDETTRHRMLVDNPAAFFRFA